MHDEPIAFPWQLGGGIKPQIHNNMTGPLTKSQTEAVCNRMAVRRLTPTEYERLQGFPDGYTDIKLWWPQTPDGPRYKALGNSMAVPVMRWIGERIDFVDKLDSKEGK